MSNYLEFVRKQFYTYKELGEKAIAQTDEQGIHWRYNDDSNSISIIVNHLAGNMLSRWTDLLTSDGEKPWRNRDSEFEPISVTKQALLARWNEGWQCFMKALEQLKNKDLEKTIYIRNQAHTVLEAINRQLAHYSYHIGQIVFIAKMMHTQPEWQSLSIPKKKSTV